MERHGFEFTIRGAGSLNVSYNASLVFWVLGDCASDSSHTLDMWSCERWKIAHVRPFVSVAQTGNVKSRKLSPILIIILHQTMFDLRHGTPPDLAVILD